MPRGKYTNVILINTKVSFHILLSVFIFHLSAWVTHDINKTTMRKRWASRRGWERSISHCKCMKFPQFPMLRFALLCTTNHPNPSNAPREEPDRENIWMTPLPSTTNNSTADDINDGPEMRREQIMIVWLPKNCGSHKTVTQPTNLARSFWPRRRRLWIGLRRRGAVAWVI